MRQYSNDPVERMAEVITEVVTCPRSDNECFPWTHTRFVEDEMARAQAQIRSDED